MSIFRAGKNLRTEYVAIGKKPVSTIHFNTQNDLGEFITHTPIILVTDDCNRTEINGFIFPVKNYAVEGMIFHSDLNFMRNDEACYFPVVLRRAEIENNLQYTVSTNATASQHNEINYLFQGCQEKINAMLLGL